MSDPEPEPEPPTEPISIDDLPDLPVCKVAVADDMDAVVRFEVEEWYAEDLLEQLEELNEEYDDNEKRLVEFYLPMEYPNFVQLTKGFAELSMAEGAAAKQVSMHPEPDVAVEVIVSDMQVASAMQRGYQTVKKYGPDHMYGQEFSTDINHIVMLIQQLELALDGVENPLDEVDASDERFYAAADE